MNKMTSMLYLCCIFSLLFSLLSCASNNLNRAAQMQNDLHGEHKQNNKNQYALKENAVTQIGNQGNYRFTLYSNESPIPLSRIHTWTVHIESLDGTPVEHAKVYVFGGMPMHNHDFPTVPKANKYLGNGDYLIEGIKFSMIGHWEIRLNIKKDKNEDRAIFKIHM